MTKKIASGVELVKADPKKGKESTVFPGPLEHQFRNALGEYNKHLNLLNICCNFFGEHIPSNGEAEFFRRQAIRFGFHSLHPRDVDFVDVRRYVISAHIAYIFSAADVLCRHLREHDEIKTLKKNYPELFKSLSSGSFLLKTIYIVAISNSFPGDRTQDKIEKLAQQILKRPEFALVEYFRIARNLDLHAAKSDDVKLNEHLEWLEKVDLGKYGGLPNAPKDFVAKDALRCSLAWQDVVKWLCRHLLNESDFSLPLIEKKFGALKPTRRVQAAKRFMKQQLLFSDADISGTMQTLGW
ncbi:hypothetical protein [uncultured Herbaspirillum sp.]|uniref:hypothetical protein n=1 Tax=uncultured Herbaspirillum sp. TaxID=160236 RepID=UPI00258C5E49|nr:hypothetical protein [uncultured Herbaspirillum sp.]